MDLFRNPLYLIYAIAALAALQFLRLWSEKRRRHVLEAFAHAGILHRLYPQEADAARRTRFWLRAGAVFFLLLALAGPQWGVELITTQTKSTQVMIAVDVSKSMLAEDLRPNRMAKAKQALSLLIDGLVGERIGLIAFAGEAFVQCPLTTDSSAVKSLLRRLTTGMVPQAGTKVGKAIDLGAEYLKKYPGHKAMVLLTDGENHGDDPIERAKEAAKEGIHLFILGMGTPEGEPIPIKDTAGRITGYKKDPNGKTVVSRLGESDLIKLAAASGGAYYRASSGEAEINQILSHIQDLDKAASSSGKSNRYKNRFRFPLFIAFLLLLGELLIADRKRKPQPSTAQKSGRTGILAACALLFLTGCSIPSDLQLIGGNDRYEGEEFGEALKKYEKADQQDARTRFNTGAALYKMGDFESAKETYQVLADPGAVPQGMAPKAYYNMGNALFRKDLLPEAAEAYKRCLLLDPQDEDCRHNLVLALRPPKSQPKKKDDKKDQKKKDQKKDKKDEQPKGGQPPPSRDRQKQMTREQAERILQAVKEKEQAAMKRQPVQMRPGDKRNTTPKEDW
jgi:tetratricopeptide (TPR) repeat protein